MIYTKNILKNTKKDRKGQKLFVLGSAAASLVASGGVPAEPYAGKKSGDVNGDPTTGNDVLTMGAGGGVADAGDGDDKITGGNAVDFMRGGAGKDEMLGGGGKDNFVVLGKISNGSYTQSDLTNPNGTGVDLSVLIDLAALNDNPVSDVVPGEIIDGGADGAILYVYGEVDFTGVTLINITRIDVHSEVTITATQLKALIDSGTFEQFIGDGTSKLIISHDGGAIELDFSDIEMMNVGSIDVAANVTLKLDQADLTGTTNVTGSGALIAVSGSLNMSGISVASGISVNGSTPTAGSGSFVKFGSDLLITGRDDHGQFDPEITTLNNGNFILVWAAEDILNIVSSDSGIWAQLYTEAGVKIGEEFQVNTYYLQHQLDPSVTALETGGFAITWYSYDHTDADKDDYSIKAQIFDAAGGKVNGEFLVNSRYEDEQIKPSISALHDGGFVISWSSEDQQDADKDRHAIKAQIFDASGNKSGGEFLVNSRYDSNQYDPEVTTLSGGGFVITWWSNDRQDADTSGRAIKAQIYTATGEEVGDEMLVNSRFDGDQNYPSIAALNNGGFVIAWHSFDRQDADTSELGVKAQFFNSVGDKVGGEISVNSQYQGDQFDSTITLLSDGNLLFAWQEQIEVFQEPTETPVNGQLFSETGVKIGDEFFITTQQDSNFLIYSISALDDGGFAITSSYKKQVEIFDSDPIVYTWGTGIKTQIFESKILPQAKIVDALQSVQFDALNTQNELPFEVSDVVLPIFETEIDFGGGDLLPDAYDYS